MGRSGGDTPAPWDPPIAGASRDTLRAVCALVLVLDTLEGMPLFVAANRDESLERPSAPPGLLVAGDRKALAPRDRRAGGTWIGCNDRSVFAAVTNRPGAVDGTRASRGTIVPLALGASSAAEARTCVEERIATGADNPFRLVVWGPDGAFAIANDGAGAIDLAPGVHLLTNEHGLGDLAPEPLQRLRAARTFDEARALVAPLLADHELNDRGHRFCKHGERYGTVSSTLLAIAGSGVGASRLLHAAGPPCRTKFRDYSNLTRRLTGR